MAWGMPGTTELIVIALVALLIFGRRLPDVARSVGRSIIEFKKGLRDVKDDIDVQSRLEAPKQQPAEPQQPVGDSSTSYKSVGQPTPQATPADDTADTAAKSSPPAAE